MRTYSWIRGCAALFLSACAGYIPQPGAGHARWAESNGISSDLDSLREGRRHYVTKCDGCHSLYDPRNFSPKEWPLWMDSMMVEILESEGELSPIDAKLIRNFLMAASGHWQDSVAAFKTRWRPAGKQAEGD